MKSDQVTAVLDVFICADAQATGIISIPGQAWSQNFSVTANSTTTISIDPAQALPLGVGIEDMAILLTSDVDVHVYARNYLSKVSDASIVLPTSGLGSEYFVTCYNPAITFGTKAAEFIIVATEDNTLVNITPTATITPGASSGNTYSITLNKGQLYQAQSYGDLTGTFIEVDPGTQGNKPIAVYGGNENVKVGGCQYYDHLYDAMIPLSVWGKEYIGVPFKNRLGDEFIVVASEDGTNIEIGGSTQNLDRGESYLYFSDSTHFVCSDKDISFTQFCRGYECDNMDGDPLMIVQSSLDQSLKEISFNAFTSTTITNYYVNVICPNSISTQLFLDGADISSQLTPLASNISYSYAKIDITFGNHYLSSNKGITASVYGFGDKESYGYSAGYSLDNSLADDYEAIGANASLCAGHSIQFNEILVSEAIGMFWDFGNQTTSTELNPETTYESPGLYDITLIVERKCKYDTIIKTIEVEDCLENLWVPTAFSPNNDGVNDLLYVRGATINDFLFRIYDRWGRLLFETNDLSKAWDGSYKDKPVYSATYIYVLQGTINGEAYSQKGNITLIR
jgi:gliding motility-associated-like protein